MKASSAASGAPSRFGTARELGERDRPVGAGHAHRAVDDLEIARRRFQRLGGELLELARRASSVAPATEAPPQGIELEPPVPVPVAMRSVSPWIIAHPLGREAEVIGDDLAHRPSRGPARSIASR